MFRFVFLVAGWLAVAFLAYQVSFAEAPKQHWDPYEILGISEVIASIGYVQDMDIYYQLGCHIA